jgi:UDP-glucose 4-epimerase
MRYVLVTGGAGFIGSHLCERLVSGGERVVALDDLSAGSEANLVALANDARFALERADVLDAGAVEGLVRGAVRVVHLAAVVGVRRVIADPVRTSEVNVRGVETVLAACVRHRRPLLFTSSSEVYGLSPRLPFREDDALLFGATHERRWVYAHAKALGEGLVLAAQRTRGLTAVVVRLFNTVGARQSASSGMVLPSLAAQAVRGAPLTVFGSGAQTRAFVHVTDTVSALEALAREPRACGRVFNVGTRRETSILELAERVRAAAGCRAPIVRMPYEEAYGADFADPPRRSPDTTRLESLVGWVPRRDLDAIVAEAVAEARLCQPASA